MDVDAKRRYFVVCSVFMEIVTPLFREILENYYKFCGFRSLQDFLNSEPVKHILFHLRPRKFRNTCCTDQPNCANGQTLPLMNYQWNLLYSEDIHKKSHFCFCKYKANDIQLSDLDITLCSLILLKCCNLACSEKDAIRLLRQRKNDYLSHNTTGQISEGEYNSLWTELTTNVLNLDPSKQDYLIMVEKRPLDEGVCSKYCANLIDFREILDEVHTSISTIHGALETGLNNMNEKFQKLLSCVQKMEKRQGQDISRLHNQIDLRSVFNVDRIDETHGVMMDDGRLVLLFHNKNILICNTDKSEVDTIQLQDYTWDVTAVNNSAVAVTLPLSKCIEIYDINNKHKLKSIPVPGWCCGITTVNNMLVVGCFARRLLTIDYGAGEVVQTIHTYCIPGRLYTSGDRIFYLGNILYSNNPNLYCYMYAQDEVITQTLPSIPYSITSLQDGSLDVVCEDGYVHHVSSDVQHYKPVKIKGLKLETNTAINYNLKKRQLMICNKETIQF